MKGRSNADRAAETTAALEAKRDWLAELVARVAEGQSLAGTSYPTVKEDFLLFEDPQRGLKKISSPKVINKKLSPARTSLIEEIEGYLGKLEAYKDNGRRPVKKPSLASQVDRLKAERKNLRYLVGRLVSQVVTLLDANRKLQESEQATEISKKLTSDTIKGLNQKVVQLGGSLVHGVKKK